MFFNQKKNNKKKDNDMVKVAALLIHAAKIDQNFSKKEDDIIKKTIIEIGADEENIEKIMNEGREIEKNSNQILDFTREVKNMSESNKIKIIESLWKIIYSNEEVDMYESNLMRRLAGLLYIDSKTMGDIKEKIRIETLK
tara:strand:- start:131 stop:550 length:420 start_codon:yes stop_codon:yes gene_type:complete